MSKKNVKKTMHKTNDAIFKNLGFEVVDEEQIEEKQQDE